MGFVEELLGVPVAVVSTGPRREETIVRKGERKQLWITPKASR
ncbi:MAG: hypothetical protein ABFS41_02910 [Myxococcota bacterium]